MMEHVVCSLCGADKPNPFLRRLDRYTGKSFDYVSCPYCGLIYLNPRPTQLELAEFYPQEYEAYYVIDEKMSPIERWLHRRALDVQLNFVERYVPQRGQLLDVGCGTGSFLKRARERGWDVVGVEWSDQAATLARESYKLDVLTGSVEVLSLPEQTANVVTLWDVLEHVPNPRETLLACNRLLVPGGILFFSIPNLASLSRSIFGKAWVGWDAPRHFNLFSEPTVKLFVESSGFELIQKHCILGEEGVFVLSLESILGTSKWRRILGIGAMLMWPYRELAYRLHKGAVITFVARKIRG